MDQYVEKRRPKLRRKGEEDGSVDWDLVKRWAMSRCCLILICAIMFLAGMIYESIKPFNVHAIHKEYAASRIRGGH